MKDRFDSIAEWLKGYKADTQEKALKLIKTDQTKYELSVLGGELKAIDEFEGEIEKILQEQAAS